MFWGVCLIIVSIIVSVCHSQLSWFAFLSHGLDVGSTSSQDSQIQQQFSCLVARRTCLCLGLHEVCFRPSHSAGPITLNVVLSQVVPELRRQRQAVYALVGGAATDHSPA